MASTYSTNLKIELMGTGEQNGLWGGKTNTNLGTAVEQAIVGKGAAVFPTDADLTLTLTNSSAAQVARAFVLNVTGTISATRNLVVPTIEKPYVVMNNTTGGQSIVVKTSAGSGITVPNGSQMFLYVDGTNVIQMLDAVGDLSYTGTLTGGTGVVNLGSGQFVKDASGNVGIGTASPLGSIDVYKATTAIGFVRTANQTLKLTADDAGSRVDIANAAGSPITFTVGVTERARIDASGNFGLGSAPGATSGRSIDLNGGAQQPLYVLRATNLTSASAYWTLNTASNLIDFGSSNWGYRWLLGSSPLMTLDTAGNLGLGVTPSAWGSFYKAIESTTASEFCITSQNNGIEIGRGYYKINAGFGSVYTSGQAASKYYQSGSGVHSWHTAPSGTAGNPISFTQAMTLDASGNLLVGTTTPASAEKFGVASSTVSGQVEYLYASSASFDGTVQVLNSARSATTGYYFTRAFANGSVVYGVFGNGNVVNTNNSYGAISDLKLKDNIVDVTPKLQKLMQVRIVNYTLKADPTKAKLIGVIAQELEQISPGLIEETPDYEEVKKTREVEVPAVEAVLDAEGNEVTPSVPATTRTEEYTEHVPTGTFTKSVKYSVFVPMIIKGVQEQQTQIEAMQAQLDTQNTAIQMLAARLEALEAK